VAAGRETLLAVKYTAAPTGNLCFNALSITQDAGPHHGPAARPAGKPLAYSMRRRKLASGIPTWQTGEFFIIFNAMERCCRFRRESRRGAKPAFF
jgi:hypothetical protein